ncbi:MAG: M56 family metallopeptidase [Planctomycetota bacterium]
MAGAVLVVLTAMCLPRIWSVASEVPSSAPAIAQAPDLSGNTQPKPDAHPFKSSETAAAGVFNLQEMVSRIRQYLPENRGENKTHTIADWLRLLGLASLLFGLVLTFRIVAGCAGLIHLRLNSTILNSAAMQRRIASYSARIGLSSSITLRTSRLLNSPCIVWLVPNTIFLPVDFGQWTEAEQQACLAHELAHIKRHDAMTRFFAAVAQVATCWHPLMWLVRREMSLAQELSADQLAMCAMGNDRQRNTLYRKGLSALALRLDARVSSHSRSVYFLSTSVFSSSLIRRIKMLKGIETVSRPAGRAGFAATLSVLVVCTWLCCWSAEAQTQEPVTPQAADSQIFEDPNVKPAAAELAIASGPFQSPAASPWDDLGGQAGFLSVRVSRLAEHPAVGPLVHDLVNEAEILIDGQSFSDFGLTVENLDRVDFSLSTVLHRTPEDGEITGWSIGGHGFSFRTGTVVQWNELVKALDWSSMLEAETGEALANSLMDSAEAGTYFCVPGMVEQQRELSPPGRLQRQMWSDVDGGIATAWISPFEVKEVLLSQMEDDEEEAFLVMASKVLEATDSFALGVDVSDTPQCELVRLAFEPSEGFSCEELMARLQEQWKVLAEFADEEDSELPQLAEQFSSLEMEVVSSDDGEYVLVTGEFSFLLSFGLQ